MSLTLPGQSGLEVLESLTRLLTMTQIIVWSSSWSPGDAARAHTLGLEPQRKPTTYGALIQLLRQWLTP